MVGIASKNHMAQAEGADDGSIEVPDFDISQKDVSKIRFPGQPFQEDLGKEGASPTTEVTANLKFPQFPRFIETPPLETDDYKMECDFIGDVSKVVFKKFDNLEVKFEDSMRERHSEKGCIALITDTLELVRKTLNILPTQDVIFTREGYLQFSVKQVNGSIINYLASPRFVLFEVPNSDLLCKKFDAELTDLKEKIVEQRRKVEYFPGEIELKAKMFNGNNEREKILLDMLEVSSKNEPERLKSIEKLSIRLEVLDKENDKNINQSKEYETLDKLERRCNYLEYFMENGKVYQGQTTSGDEVDVHDGEGVGSGLQFLNKEGKLIGVETATSDEIIVKENLSSPSSSCKYIKFGEYPKVSKIERYTMDELLVTENFNLKGELVTKENQKIGVVDHYYQGKYAFSSLVDPVKLIKNPLIAILHPNKDMLLLEAAMVEPLEFLRNYKDYKVDSNFQKLLDVALTNLPESDVHRLRVESETYLSALSNAKGKQRVSLEEMPLIPWDLHNLNDSEITELTELLKFRERMLVDAREIVRSDFTSVEGKKESDAQRQSVAVFNDPSSRGYFEIKDEWINWDEERIMAHLNKDDMEGSKKEFKLLVARYLYQDNLEVTKENVNYAISKIMDLQDQESLKELFASRNVVVAAHGDTLASERGRERPTFSEGLFMSNIVRSERFEHAKASGDYHQFAKQSLVDAIKERQGPGYTFELLRPEPDLFKGLYELESGLTDFALDNEVVSEILRKVAPHANSKGEINLLQIEKAIEEVDLHHRSPEELIDHLRDREDVISKDLINVKEQIISSIVNTPPPFLFIFDGHGSPDGVFLSDGSIGLNNMPEEMQSTIKITPEELSAAIEQRKGKFKNELVDNQDIFVFQSCYNANFITKVNSTLSNSKENPTFIGASEFNQVSFYNLGHQNYSPVLFNVLGLGELPEGRQGGRVGDVRKRQFYKPAINLEGGIITPSHSTNPVMFAPDKDGRMRQFSTVTKPAKDVS